jgi:hypothetical protein
MKNLYFFLQISPTFLVENCRVRLYMFSLFHVKITFIRFGDRKKIIIARGKTYIPRALKRYMIDPMVTAYKYEC